jgi:hypothetical protein
MEGKNKMQKAKLLKGPPPALAMRFEQIRQLPRKEQEFVIRFLDTVFEGAGKA